MKRKAALFVCLALALGLLALPAAGAVPEPPANGSVLDVAGVLAQDTVTHILERNERLSAATGAVIAVATVERVNGRNIADYADEIFQKWSIGDQKAQNGLLIFLSIGDGDYYILQGSGIQKDLPPSALGEYCWNYLERDFSAGDYDAGVHKLYDALYSWFEGHYALDLSTPETPAASQVPAQPSAPALEEPASPETVPADEPQPEAAGKKGMGLGKLLLILVIVLGVVVAADAVRYYIWPGGGSERYRPLIFGRRARPRRTRAAWSSGTRSRGGGPFTSGGGGGYSGRRTRRR